MAWSPTPAQIRLLAMLYLHTDADDALIAAILSRGAGGPPVAAADVTAEAYKLMARYEELTVEVVRTVNEHSLELLKTRAMVCDARARAERGLRQ
ncbi:MAG: hypothetical protein M1832_004381 [Thelocarpon impressellum]|nr:MAG: hypothetical protein M1832_004381 [Thelocarpon impressellum]